METESGGFYACFLIAGKEGRMGQKDISLVRFFEDQARFADLLNGFVFDGRSVVSEDDVWEEDSRVIGTFRRLKERIMVQKFRDCVRKVVFGTNFAVIGIENQDRVHYGMPVRIMVEDAAGYDKQMRQIKRRHRSKRDLRGDEFLGGIARCDRIHPVVTICIYYGKEPYDGAKELYQMMEFEELPEGLKGLMNNYTIHVLEINSFKDIDRFQTDLREVFGFIRYSGDVDAERAFTEENEEKFRELAEDAFDVIVAVTGSKELGELKDAYREEGGKINMCEAIRGMINDGIEQGRNEGEDNFALLTEKLLKDSRTEDLLKATTDKLLRRKLFEEYGITKNRER